MSYWTLLEPYPYRTKAMVIHRQPVYSLHLPFSLHSYLLSFTWTSHILIIEYPRNSEVSVIIQKQKNQKQKSTAPYNHLVVYPSICNGKRFWNWASFHTLHFDLYLKLYHPLQIPPTAATKIVPGAIAQNCRGCRNTKPLAIRPCGGAAVESCWKVLTDKNGGSCAVTVGTPKCQLSVYMWGQLYSYLDVKFGLSLPISAGKNWKTTSCGNKKVKGDQIF